MLLPVIGLAMLEVVLRLAGYGHPTGFFKEVNSKGGRYLVDNEYFSLRFFPPELARWPGSVKLAAEKPGGVRRIFVFGESAAMGDPQPAYSASRYLEVMLQERFPGERFEIINLGITAINSHVILQMARDCAARQGDIWIIYMGNNEMVGPFGAATVFGARAPPLAWVKLNLVFLRSRVGQLLVAWSRQLGGKSKETSWGGMRMFMQNQVPPADKGKERVYRNFERNLRDIVDAGLASGAQVILSTVSVNLRDCPPFASVTNNHMTSAMRAQFEGLYAEGMSLEKAAQYADAAQRFESAAGIDPEHAELQFRWGSCLLQLTNSAAARVHYQRACDNDALPFRADSRVNAVIKQAARGAAGRRLVLCDAEAALSGHSPVNIAGAESFFEHVHFNFEGNYRLAMAWGEKIAGMLAGATNAAAPGEWPSQAKCEEALGLTDWNREFVMQAVIRRLNQPPLSNQLNNAARLEAAQTVDGALQRQKMQPGAREKAVAILNAAIRRAPTDPFAYEGMANFLEDIGDTKDAIQAYRELLKVRPNDFYAALQLGRMLGEQGQPREAEPYLRAATRLRSSLPEGWLELGLVLAAQQQFPEALECLTRAKEIRPQDPAPYCYTGKVLAKMKRRTEAIAQYRRAIQMRPDYREAHFELASELAWENQVAESIQEYREVLRINPRDTVSHINLGVMLVRENRQREAIEQFEQALALDPNNKAAQEYLGKVTERRNK
jgi:tetratricopeptide (TPR) repeat protein